MVLLAAPQLIARGGAAKDKTLAVQIVFSVLVLIGLRLTFVGWIAKPRAASWKSAQERAR